METFSALLALCVGNSPVTGEFPSQRPVTRSFDVFFDRQNKKLSKQSWGWWFETPSCSLWRHCNGMFQSQYTRVRIHVVFFFGVHVATDQESGSISFIFIGWYFATVYRIWYIKYWCNLLYFPTIIYTHFMLYRNLLVKLPWKMLENNSCSFT